MKQRDYERLEDIRRDMIDLLSEAGKIIRAESSGEYNIAKHTWISAIDVGLGGGNFMDTHAHTFEKTLAAINVEESEPDEDEEWEPDPII